MADEATIKSFLVELGYKVDATSSDRFIDAIASATKRVMELGAAIEGAVLGVIGFTTEVASELSKLYFESERTKTSAENLRAFAFAMSNIGISTEEAHSAMMSMAKFMASSPGAMPWMQQLFDQFANGAKVTQDVTENLKNLGTAFVHMGEQQAIAWGTARGLSYEFIESLLHHTQEIQGFENTLHEAYARVGFDLKDGTEKSVKFMNELRTVWAAGLEPLIEKIAVSMMPKLTEEMERFRQLVLNNSRQIEEVALAVVRGIMWVGDEILHIGGNVATFVGDIIKWFESLDAPTKHLIELIGSISTAFYLLNRNPFVFIIGGLLALISDYEDWKRGSAHFIDWDTWGPEIKQGIDQFIMIASWIDKLVKATTGWCTVLEALAIYMGGKWLIGMMAGLGPISSKIALLVAALELIKSMNKDIDLKDLTADSPLWEGIPEAEQLKYPNSPASRARAGTQNDNPNPFEWYNPGTWGNQPGTNQNAPSGVMPTGPLFGAQIHQEAFESFGGGGFGGMLRFGGGGQRGSAGDAHTADMLMQYFEAQGWTHAQAAGIVGNLQAESALNPNAANASGHIGLAQWDQHRQELYAQIFGHRMDDPRISHMQALAEQAEFIQWELTHTEAIAGHLLGASGNFAQAADAFNQGYERSGVTSGSRVGLAGSDYGRYSQPPPQAGGMAVGAAAGASKPTVTNTQNISNTINTTADPNAIVNALNRVSDRANADIVRQTRSALVGIIGVMIVGLGACGYCSVLFS